jgi:hypothetical protein
MKIFYTNEFQQPSSIEINVGDVFTSKNGKHFVVLSAYDSQMTKYGHVSASINLGVAGKSDDVVVSKNSPRQFASRFLKTA